MKKVFLMALFVMAVVLVAAPTGCVKAPKVKEITSAGNFDNTIRNKKKLVLVDFWASWCGPCRMIAPNIETIATEMSDKLVVAKLDIEQVYAAEFTQKYKISSIPCMIVFENGKEIGRNVGYMTKAELRTWLSKYIK